VDHDEFLLIQLENLAEKLGVTLRHENVDTEESSGTGGLCRIEGEYVLFLHSRSTIKEKIKVMIKALKRFDLSNVYVLPVIRELFDRFEDE
jgi:hypothetical protein